MDHLDLYYGTDAQIPSWILIGTLYPTHPGAQTLTVEYTLPPGALQAIRAALRRGASADCTADVYDDHDDLVFAVGADGLQYPAFVLGLGQPLLLDGTSSTSGSNPSTRISFTDPLDSVVGFDWDLNGDADFAGNCLYAGTGIDRTGERVELTQSELEALGIAAVGDHPVWLRAWDPNENVHCAQAILRVDMDHVAPIVQVLVPDGGESWMYSEPGTPRTHYILWTSSDNQAVRRTRVSYTTGSSSSAVLTASHDPVLLAPRCNGIGSACDSGALLDGRDTIAGGNEPNQPNTILSSCADGTMGMYHSDESIDRIVISTLDGTAMAVGKTVRIDVTVWPFSADYASDHLDLYYATDATAPIWNYITTLTPPQEGLQVLSATYALPAGDLQAVRAQFRYLGAPDPCAVDNYTDHDDLIFSLSNWTCIVDSDNPSGCPALGMATDAQSFLWTIPTEAEATAAGQTFPTATARVKVEVWDEPANTAADTSDANFYIIQPTTTAVKTLILWNSVRIEDKYPGSPPPWPRSWRSWRTRPR